MIIPFPLPDPKRFPMRRVALHWTVGRHEPNSTDMRAYHVLITGLGAVVRGRYGIEQNSGITRARADAGEYAAHVARMNEGSIGVSMCGCFVAQVQNKPGIGSEFPLTSAQWHAAVKVCRELVQHFGITETETRGAATGPTVIGHCEVEPVWGIPQGGKIDPWRPMPEWPWSIGKTPAQIAAQFREQVWRPEGR